MISKPKMIIVSSLLDDSIKAITPIYDVLLFKSFVDLEQFVDATPIIVDTLIVSADACAFNSTNMVRLMNVYKSPFFTLQGSLIYLVGQEVKLEVVLNFVESKQLQDWVVYQGDLAPGFISDIITGEGRSSEEGRVDLVTYRVRTNDYVAMTNNGETLFVDNDYVTDDEDLAGIPDVSIPEDVIPTIQDEALTYHVVGKNSVERTLFAFLLQQYLSMSGKTLIVERDWHFHLLTEFVTKAGVDCEFIQVKELFKDIRQGINRIANTTKRMVVVGCVDYVDYDYTLLFDILVSNLSDHVSNFVKECSFEEAPYGKPYIIVMGNTIPAVLESCSLLSFEIGADTTFVGLELNELYPATLTSDEMSTVISSALQVDKITSQVIKAKSLLLRKGSNLYDICSLIRPNL